MIIAISELREILNKPFNLLEMRTVRGKQEPALAQVRKPVRGGTEAGSCASPWQALHFVHQFADSLETCRACGGHGMVENVRPGILFTASTQDIMPRTAADGDTALPHRPWIHLSHLSFQIIDNDSKTLEDWLSDSRLHISYKAPTLVPFLKVDDPRLGVDTSA